jgi:hypothetical protein
MENRFDTGCNGFETLGCSHLWNGKLPAGIVGSTTLKNKLVACPKPQGEAVRFSLLAGGALH